MTVADVPDAKILFITVNCNYFGASALQSDDMGFAKLKDCKGGPQVRRFVIDSDFAAGQANNDLLIANFQNSYVFSHVVQLDLPFS